jgi:hypothetical protein
MPAHQGRKIHFRGRQNLQHPPRHPLPSPRSRCVKAQQIELDAEYDEFYHPSIILAERVTGYLLMSR